MYILRVALGGLNGRGHLGLDLLEKKSSIHVLSVHYLYLHICQMTNFIWWVKFSYHHVGKIVGVCKCFLRRLVSRPLIRFCRTCAILYNTVPCLVPKTSLTSVDKCLEPGWKFLLLNIRIRCVGAIDTSMLWSHRCCNLFICSWNQLFLNARTAN